MTRRNRLSSVATFVAVILLGIARVFDDHTNSWWPLAVAAVALLTWLGTRTIIGRRNARARQTISVTATQHPPS